MKKNILIVDDEENIQALLEDILLNEGYNTVISDGDKDEILKVLNEQRIDLIILDIMMPKMSGRDLYIALKKDLKNTDNEKKLPPAVILTAHPGSMNTQSLLMEEPGIKKLISKPFQILEFLENIAEVLENG